MINYPLLLIVFLVIASLSILGIKLYSKFLSPQSRRLKSRVKSLKVDKNNNKKLSGLKVQDIDSPIIEFIKSLNLPFIIQLELMIIRSGSAKKLQDILLYSSLLFLVGIIIIFSISLALILKLVFLIMITGSPVYYLYQLEQKRVIRFNAQFPNALDHLSRSLKAGNALAASIGLVADDMSDPVSYEFRQTFEEINFGLSFDQSLNNLATRIKSNDLNFFVIALLIQRESGGNLTELLANLSLTMRDRVKLHGKIKTLAAEGKFSGNLLSVFPFLLGLVFYLINPEYMMILFTTPQGRSLCVAGLILMAIGYVWLMRITKIKV
ncbi:MAG: hypothetical protein RLZZ181_468 [Pseudomonadota bacterium]|jgi:tight adherence protein B